MQTTSMCVAFCLPPLLESGSLVSEDNSKGSAVDKQERNICLPKVILSEFESISQLWTNPKWSLKADVFYNTLQTKQPLYLHFCQLLRACSSNASFVSLYGQFASLLDYFELFYGRFMSFDWALTIKQEIWKGPGAPQTSRAPGPVRKRPDHWSTHICNIRQRNLFLFTGDWHNDPLWARTPLKFPLD